MESIAPTKVWEIEKSRLREYEEWVEAVWGDTTQDPERIAVFLRRMVEQASGNDYEALKRLLLKHEELRMLSISCLGLNEEAGEVTGPIKKFIRNPIKHPIDRDVIIDECGDVLYYLTKILGWVDSSLDEAMTVNQMKINVRYRGEDCPGCNNLGVVDGNDCRICKGRNRT